MRITLTESQRHGVGTARAMPATLVSVVVHVGLLSGAVMLTRPAVGPAPVERVGELPIVFPDAPRHPQARAPEPVHVSPLVETGPRLPLPTFEIPKGIPPVDSTAAPIDLSVFARTRTIVWSAPFGGTSGDDADAVYAADVVDEPPTLLWSPKIAYPPLLRQAKIEGHVLIEVVVDTLGHPDPQSVRVLDASDARFVSVARSLVRRSRFRAGRAHGRRVAVVVRFPVVFRIAPRD